MGLRLAAVLLCVAPPPAAADDTSAADAKALQGTWAWDKDAKQSDAEPVVLVDKIVIAGDTLTIHYDLGGKKFTTPTTFKLDAAATPKRIDFTPSDVGNANTGKWYSGLYVVKDGRLKICYRGPGSTRPKDFDDGQDRAANAVTTYLAVTLNRGG